MTKLEIVSEIDKLKREIALGMVQGIALQERIAALLALYHEYVRVDVREDRKAA